MLRHITYAFTLDTTLFSYSNFGRARASSVGYQFILQNKTDRLDSRPTYFRYYKTDCVSSHLEVRHCGAIRIGWILV